MADGSLESGGSLAREIADALGTQLGERVGAPLERLAQEVQLLKQDGQQQADTLSTEVALIRTQLVDIANALGAIVGALAEVE